jgi:hypothetical protein
MFWEKRINIRRHEISSISRTRSGLLLMHSEVIYEQMIWRPRLREMWKLQLCSTLVKKPCILWKMGRQMTNMKPVTQEVTGDDSCKVIVQTLNKVLENITEVITCLKHHTDNEHLHLLHATSIKHYVLRKTLSSVPTNRSTQLFQWGSMKCKYRCFTVICISSTSINCKCNMHLKLVMSFNQYVLYL